MAPAAKKAAAVQEAQKASKALRQRKTKNVRKVRHTVHFRRPKTLILPKAPRYPRKSCNHVPRMDHYKVLRCPLTTEASMKKVEEMNTLVFLCDPRANKVQIRSAVKALYGVKPLAVNTLIRPDGIKKAYVKLSKDSDAVDVASKNGFIL